MKNTNVFEKDGLKNTVDELFSPLPKRYLVTVEKEYVAESEDEARDMFLAEAENLAKYTAEVVEISDIPF